METALGVLGLVIGLVLLWTGVRRVNLSSYLATLLSLLDFALLVAGMVVLGWAGAALFGAVNLVAFLVTSIRLAAKKEELLVYAATQFDASKADVYALFDRLGDQHRVWKVIGPIDRAELIAAMSQRGRSLNEAEQMLLPVALLWSNDRRRVAVDHLTEKFDRLMRLAGEPPDQSMRVADVLTAAAQRSAATFTEILDAAIAAYEP